MSSFDKGAVHIFTFCGERFAVDINTGSFLCVDEPSYKFIELLLNGNSPEIAEERIKEIYGDESSGVAREIESLIESGVIFSKSIPYFQSTLMLKSLCLNVSHMCNFSCSYCFAKKGSYGGREGIMSIEVAQKSIEYLVKHSSEAPQLEVDFFGGEPLLAYPLIQETIEYAKKKYPEIKWRFTLTTNASILDKEKEDFLYDNDVSIVLSLDGGRAVNDAFRVTGNGKGTFDIVVPHIRYVAEHRKQSEGYYVRGTYTHRTLSISDSVKALRELGCKFISLEPVVTDNEDISIKESDLEDLREEYEKLAKFYVESGGGREWKFFHFNIDTEAGPCIQKRVNGCGAGVEYLAISPCGDIYPCHQFDGISSMKLGDIFSGNVEDRVQQRFKDANYLFNKSKCAQCWARFYCSGGCLANNYRINDDLMEPYGIGCKIQKMRIEAALYVQYRLNGGGI